MKCVHCLAAYERNALPALQVEDALVVFSGISLCRRHLNIARGHAADFDHYEKDAL